jgi:hypothetical protein
MSIPTGHGTQTLQEQERRIALALIEMLATEPRAFMRSCSVKLVFAII